MPVVYKGGIIIYRLSAKERIGMTKVVVYTRVFTEKDSDDLELQEEICMNFCNENAESLFGDLDINYIIFSDIVPKSDTDRALLSSGMRELRKKKDIRYLVVKSFDVITSDVGVMKDFLNDLDKRNIRLIVAEQGYEKVVDNAIRLNQELKKYKK